MPTDKDTKIDIPESIERYTVTLFWGMTISQIVLVFIATLFVGFAVFNVASHNYVIVLFMLIIAGLSLLGIVEIKGRNIYRYLLFIASYYKSKPRVLIYNHYSINTPKTLAKQLVYQKENHTKTFVYIIAGLTLGLLLLSLTGIYLFHVTHH